MSSSREQEFKEYPAGAAHKPPRTKPVKRAYSRVDSSDDEDKEEIVVSEEEEKGESLTALASPDISVQVYEDTFATLALAAQNLIDRQQALLTRDAKAYKDALDKSAKQEKLLNQARKSSKNIGIAIRKFERDIAAYTKKLQRLEELSETECAQIQSRLDKAQANLALARERQAKVTHEIPRIQASMEKLQKKKKTTAETFTSHFPMKTWAYEKLYVSYLFVDLLFTSYIFVSCALSFQDFAKAWKLGIPSTELSYSLILGPALMDLAFNMLLINIHESAINEVYADYDKYRFKSYRRIANDYITNLTQNTSAKSLVLAVLNQASISAHNLIGASADFSRHQRLSGQTGRLAVNSRFTYRGGR